MSGPRRVAVIGGGPAGLMAAETVRAAGYAVDLYEAKGSVGRKFLIAGKGGLNLTHSDPPARFASRYRQRQREVADWLSDFDAEALRDWAAGLGVQTFIGSSGRVFPLDRKAAPLLRGWVKRLKDSGVQFHVQHRWLGWSEHGALRLATPTGEVTVDTAATILALGGGSWPQLGADGTWLPVLQHHGIAVAPLQPANCGFDVVWSEHFRQRHAGAPLKSIHVLWTDLDGVARSLQGECVVSQHGIEGSLIYAIAADLRETIRRDGHALLHLDLAPAHSLASLQQQLQRPHGGRSLSEQLRRRLGLDGVKTALLYEVLGREAGQDMARLAATIKQLPLRLLRPRPISEAISSAGGVLLQGLDRQLMWPAQPGLFCAGEMLDWEAPTGGYLLTACFASGVRAGRGAVAWLQADAAHRAAMATADR